MSMTSVTSPDMEVAAVSNFEKECLETANKLEKLALCEGCTLTKDGALAAIKAAMLLKEVVRGV